MKKERHILGMKIFKHSMTASLPDATSTGGGNTRGSFSVTVSSPMGRVAIVGCKHRILFPLR